MVQWGVAIADSFSTRALAEEPFSTSFSFFEKKNSQFSLGGWLRTRWQAVGMKDCLNRVERSWRRRERLDDALLRAEKGDLEREKNRSTDADLLREQGDELYISQLEVLSMMDAEEEAIVRRKEEGWAGSLVALKAFIAEWQEKLHETAMRRDIMRNEVQLGTFATAECNDGPAISESVARERLSWLSPHPAHQDALAQAERESESAGAAAAASSSSGVSVSGGAVETRLTSTGFVGAGNGDHCSTRSAASAAMRNGWPRAQQGQQSPPVPRGGALRNRENGGGHRQGSTGSNGRPSMARAQIQMASTVLQQQLLQGQEAEDLRTMNISPTNRPPRLSQRQAGAGQWVPPRALGAEATAVSHCNISGLRKRPPQQHPQPQQQQQEVRRLRQNTGQAQEPGNSTLPPELAQCEPEMVEKINKEIIVGGKEVRLDDVAGLKFAKATLHEAVINPLMRPDLYTGLRQPAKGVLLFGPPGTGKTFLAKAIACESKCTFFSISASSLMSKWIGEAEKLVRALFAVARYRQPSIVFIDEVDSLLSSRTKGEDDASRRVKTEFLVQLDGAGVNDEGVHILILGATNRPEELDEAARRRFIKRVYIPLPTAPARLELLRLLLRLNDNIVSEQELGLIVERTKGFSAADITNLCRTAANLPLRGLKQSICDVDVKNLPPISFSHFDDALKGTRSSVSENEVKVSAKMLYNSSRALRWLPEEMHLCPFVLVT